MLSLGAAAVCLAGCGTSGRLDALVSGAGAVSFLQISNARFDGDDGEALRREIWQSLTREWPRLSNTMLAISGGQEDGAFGAGLLVGWSEHGSRPQFKIVTGTSTGALAAPFAFLGDGAPRCGPRVGIGGQHGMSPRAHWNSPGCYLQDNNRVRSTFHDRQQLDPSVGPGLRCHTLEPREVTFF